MPLMAHANDMDPGPEAVATFREHWSVRDVNFQLTCFGINHHDGGETWLDVSTGMRFVQPGKEAAKYLALSLLEAQ